MKITINEIKAIVETVIDEIDIGSVEGISCAAGSTHIMNTCKIDDDKYFLKFSDEDLFDGTDPSLQILVEYMAYKIYELYPSVRTPNVKLVSDPKRKRVGLASSAASGKAVGNTNISPEKLAKMLTGGIYVDILLANWDVIGTGTGNVMIDQEKDTATRIDPGGSLTFRAQGGKKGSLFNKDARELQTMLEPGMGAGDVYQYADLKEAAKEFTAISWESISERMMQVNNKEIVPELKGAGLIKLLGEWKEEVLHIHQTLKERYLVISKQISFID